MWYRIVLLTFTLLAACGSPRCTSPIGAAENCEELWDLSNSSFTGHERTPPSKKYIRACCSDMAAVGQVAECIRAMTYPDEKEKR